MDELMYYANAYLGQLKKIEEDMVKISNMAMELELTKEGIDKLGENFLPIGGGMLVKAKVEENRILVPIGLNYFMYMNKEDAKKEIDKRIEAAKKSIERLKKDHQSIKAILDQIEKKLEEENARNPKA